MSDAITLVVVKRKYVIIARVTSHIGCIRLEILNVSEILTPFCNKDRPFRNEETERPLKIIETLQYWRSSPTHFWNEKTFKTLVLDCFLATTGLTLAVPLADCKAACLFIDENISRCDQAPSCPAWYIIRDGSFRSNVLHVLSQNLQTNKKLLLSPLLTL